MFTTGANEKKVGEKTETGGPQHPPATAFPQIRKNKIGTSRRTTKGQKEIQKSKALNSRTWSTRFPPLDGRGSRTEKEKKKKKWKWETINKGERRQKGGEWKAYQAGLNSEANLSSVLQVSPQQAMKAARQALGHWTLPTWERLVNFEEVEKRALLWEHYQKKRRKSGSRTQGSGKEIYSQKERLAGS